MQQPARPASTPDPAAHGQMRRVGLFAALTGFGLAGLFDSLVLHRLLGWHHLLLGVQPDAPLSDHLRADALFDGIMYAALLTGLTGAMIWRSTVARIPPRCLTGMVLLGFGAWHVTDAVIVHWLLGLHRIRPAAPMPLAWDIGWLVTFGLLPLVIGLSLRGPARPVTPPSN